MTTWNGPTVPIPARRRPRPTRQNIAIFVVATLVGIWLGATAPDTSPVAPPATAPQEQAR